MTRAIAFGLATLALGFFIRTAALQQAAAEVSARDADGQRPATLHEIRSLLKDLAAVSAEIEATREAIVPRLFCREDRPYSGPEIARMIRCSTRRFGGDANKMIQVGSCESGLQANEHGNLPYRGVFQYHPDTWANAAAAYWRPAWGRRHVQIPGIYNGRAQVIVTNRYTNAHGWGPWSCA